MKIFYVLIVAISTVACHKTTGKNAAVIQFYEKSHKPIITDEESGITYRFMAKITNISDKPIVVPYIEYHQLPVEKTLDCVVKDDSLIDFQTATIPGDFPLFGVDTIFPNETQRNFVNVTRFETKIRRSAYRLFDFRYYFLEDYAKNGADDNMAMHEYYIVLNDTIENKLRIYRPIEGFDPRKNKSHPIPK